MFLLWDTKTSATTSPLKIKFSFLPRTTAQRVKKTTMAKSPNAVHALSLSSSRHLNLYSSPRPSTPALHPTKATYVPPYASPTMLSPCPPTHHRRSSALFVKAPACTSPLSCHLLWPVAQACPLPLHPSQPHAAYCDLVSKKEVYKTRLNEFPV